MYVVEKDGALYGGVPRVAGRHGCADAAIVKTQSKKLQELDKSMAIEELAL
jgi:hypothetical protein